MSIQSNTLVNLNYEYYHAIPEVFNKNMMAVFPDSELMRKFWTLQDEWWRQFIDGRFHKYGPMVFDQGLNGFGAEPGFLNSLLKGCLFAMPYLGQTLSIEFYQDLNRTLCSHFKGKENNTLMSSDQAGKFRESNVYSLHMLLESNDQDAPFYYLNRSLLESLKKTFCVQNSRAFFFQEEKVNRQVTFTDVQKHMERFISNAECSKEVATQIKEMWQPKGNIKVTDLMDEIERNTNAWIKENERRSEERIQQINLDIQEFSDSIGVSRPIATLEIVSQENKESVIRVNNEKFWEEEFRKILEALFNDYEQEIKEINAQTSNTMTVDDDEKKIRCIAKLFQRLEWVHAFPDGAGRTHLVLLTKLLIEEGLCPAILDQPYMSNVFSLEEWIDYLKKGMEKWRIKATEMKQSVECSWTLGSNLGAQSLMNKIPFRTHFSAHEKLKRTRVQSIIARLLGGQSPHSSDLSFLRSSQRFSYLSNMINHPSTQQIFELKERMLGVDGDSVNDILRDIQEILSSKQGLFEEELADFSKVILGCLEKAQNQSDRLQTFVKELESKPLIDRSQLIWMIDQWNGSVLPKKTRAGEVVAKTCLVQSRSEVSIQWNQMGFLEMVDGMVSPLEISSPQVLSTEQEADLIDFWFDEFDTHLFFNELMLPLEFANFHEKMRQVMGHHWSVQDSYKKFHPELADLVDKYHSGDSLSIASKFIREIHEKFGIQGYCTASSSLDSEEEEAAGEALSKGIGGFDHADVRVVYRDKEQKRLQSIKFYRSAESLNSGLPDEYSCVTLDPLVSERPNSARDPGAIAKVSLKKRFKHIMRKENKTMGVDFKKGNVYINQVWSEILSGIPKNKEGQLSLLLEDLAHPDEQQVYFIDGAEVHMSHKGALELLLEKVKDVFFIPDAMAENIIALARMAPEIRRIFLRI